MDPATASSVPGARFGLGSDSPYGGKQTLKGCYTVDGNPAKHVRLEMDFCEVILKRSLGAARYLPNPF